MEGNQNLQTKIHGTDFVMCQVSDQAKAAWFYRETPGRPQEVYSEEYQWAEFNCGNVSPALKGGKKLLDVIAGGRIALAVEDVQAAYMALKRKGVRFAGEPVDYSVCQVVKILDPEGNTVILHLRADGAYGQNAKGPRPIYEQDRTNQKAPAAGASPIAAPEIQSL